MSYLYTCLNKIKYYSSLRAIRVSKYSLFNCLYIFFMYVGTITCPEKLIGSPLFPAFSCVAQSSDPLFLSNTDLTALLQESKLSTIHSASSLNTMDVGGDPYGPFPGGNPFGGSIDGSVHLGRSASVRNGSVRSYKTDEAFLLSQATTTAMIAAKSILLSGGTEETALKTAKAAAQSILNPGTVDADCVSGKSNTFLRRRKAKRQAEVVASMALMSATSNIQSAANNDWETMSMSSASQNPFQQRNMSPRHQNMNHNPFMTGFAQNITTRPQDEPSVLSSVLLSERERSHQNNMLPPTKSPVAKRVQKEQQPLEESRPPKPTKQASPVSRQPSYSNRSPRSYDSVPLARMGSERTEISKQIERVRSRRKNLQANLQEAGPNNSHGSSQDQQSVVVRLLKNDPSSSSSEEPEHDDDDETHADDETLDSMGTYDESVERRFSNVFSKPAEKNNGFITKQVDPFLFSFTNAFNAFSCGPTDLNGLMGDEREDYERFTQGKRKSGGVKALKTVEHRDDVDAQNVTDDDGTDFMSGDDDTDIQDAKQEDEEELRDVLESFDKSRIQSDPSNGTSRSPSIASVESEQILSELNLSTSEEGDIQVRSTIRETMEQIVSKSHMKVKKYDASNTDVDRSWLAYELGQGESPEMVTSTTVQAPTVQTTATKNVEDKDKDKRGWFRTKREVAAAKLAKQAKKITRKQATHVYY
jgi:hypothetical protein